MMKKTLLLLMLLSSLLSFGQFELEQTYYYTRGVQRIVLENSGEKYFYVDYQTGTIQLFNADHTPWKTINITLPPDNYSLYVFNISETLINADDNLEIIYSTYSAPGIRRSKIVNELGMLLLSEENCYRFLIDKKEGMGNKIISSKGVVYSLPSLAVEHTYPYINDANVKRVNLENSGEKYYFLDRANSLAVLYNSDHTFWKNIALPIPEGYSIFNIDILSENQLNSDSLIEVGYSCQNNVEQQSRIANENGETLLIATNPGNFEVSSVEGLPNKLMVYYMPGDIPDETSRRTDVYDIPTFNLEHTYQQFVYRVKLENSGEKYHANNYDYLTSDITIYNSDHSLWKTVTTPAINGETIENVFISETKIDLDDALELIYTISSNTLDGGHYYGFIVKENGTVILDLPGAYDVFLSEFPSLETKLMVYSQDGPSFDQLYYTTTVYHFDPTSSANEFDNLHFNFAPNPANSDINLFSKLKIAQSTLYNSLGVIVKKWEDNDITTINVENFPSGIYLLELLDSNNQKSTHKVIISH